MSETKRTRRVVVLGAGFAGVYTAKYLESMLRPGDDTEIVLINKENYFVFQPLLAEVVSGNIGILDTVSPLRRLLKKTTIYIRNVEHIDLEAKTVRLSPGFWPRPLVLEYDHLVVALGSVTDFRGMTGLFEHALPFKNLADAIFLRNHLIHAIEEASIVRDDVLRRQLLTFVVAGGGFSGVEVAAEMNDFVRRVAREYKSLDPKEVRVMLVHSGERVLDRELGEGLSTYAMKILQKRGLELKLGCRLKTATPDAAILADGERIPTKTLVSTVPSSPHPLVETLDVPKDRGKITVDRFLQITGSESLWAAGDCALIPDPSGQGFCPPTAQHAIRQAKTLAANIAARIRGSELQPFDFTGLGKMGSLGHRSAVAELFGRVRLSGMLAWFLWRSVYWWKLPGLDRRIKVGISWFLDLLMPADYVQLKIGDAPGMDQSHFEPGETVFEEGDLGDCLYIILSGTADVVRRENGEDQLLATLNAGEYFGEMALMNQHTRSATVRCRTAVDVLTLRKTEFNTLAANLPELRDSIEHVMQRRMLNQPGGTEPEEVEPEDVEPAGKESCGNDEVPNDK